MRVRRGDLWVKGAAVWLGSVGCGWAHVSEQGFVLLLPTGVYTAAGVAVVALTVALLALSKGGVAPRLRPPPEYFQKDKGEWASLAVLALVVALVWVGLEGPRDPLSNLMPLVFWTVWWVALVSLAAVVGDFWRRSNPWSAVPWILGWRAPWSLPGWVGHWPAVALLVGFGGFLLADVAPDDPARLALLVAGYWGAMMIGVLLFGRSWLQQVEMFSTLVSLYGALSPFRRERLTTRMPEPGLGLFALVLLGLGSFDGLNETFWWLARIGVNPLEFPGRSAVVLPTLAGLTLSVLALGAVFAGCVWAGTRLVDGRFTPAFGRLALSVLPIALGYHVAHYLTAFLVNGQYVIAALSDPLGRGGDLLGIAPFYVTTGFFNRIDTVRLIWLAQAGAVVGGHVWAVILAHRMSVDMFGPGRRAALATAPLSGFMIAYTFLGLWLLAAPRGA